MLFRPLHVNITKHISFKCRAVNKALTLAPYKNTLPKLADNVFVAPNASVIGDVTIGRGSSVWYGAVLRGMSVWNSVLIQKVVLV